MSNNTIKSELKKMTGEEFATVIEVLNKASKEELRDIKEKIIWKEKDLHAEEQSMEVEFMGIPSMTIKRFADLYQLKLQIKESDHTGSVSYDTKFTRNDEDVWQWSRYSSDQSDTDTNLGGVCRGFGDSVSASIHDYINQIVNTKLIFKEKKSTNITIVHVPKLITGVAAYMLIPKEQLNETS